jgi:hypothetical protein
MHEMGIEVLKDGWKGFWNVILAGIHGREES